VVEVPYREFEGFILEKGLISEKQESEGL
jgi:hypothetical protein